MLNRLSHVLGAISLIVALIGSVAVFATASCTAMGGTPSGERLARMQQLPMYLDGTFHNEEPTDVMTDDHGNRWRTMRALIFGNDAMIVPTCPLPMVHDAPAQWAQPPSSGLRVTWMGHSTTLIEIDGKRVLTDPMWSERASPTTIAGPKRFHPPPVALADLPPIDAVIISHDHYDHLDMNTVQQLAARGVHFHVAVGVGAHLQRWDVPDAQIHEHIWWEPTDLGGGVQVVSTPSRHFSGRGLFNRNTTLWTSWSVLGPKHRVFFSGDTGQTRYFGTIRDKIGPFDLALLEIGQWNEAWGQIHLGPRGALQAFNDIGAAQLVPIHWSTFALGLHAWSEPPDTLLAESGTRRADILTPRLGEPHRAHAAAPNV